MAGKKGCSGRKKIPSKVINELFDKVAVEDYPDIVKKMVEEAKAGDRQMQIYISDRILGKPSISVDNRVKGEVDINWGAVKVAVISQVNSLNRVVEGEYKLVESSNGQQQDSARDS